MSDRQQSSIEVIPHVRTARLNEQYNITNYARQPRQGIGIPNLDETMHTILEAYRDNGYIGAVPRDQLEVALCARACETYTTGMGIPMGTIDTLASDSILDFTTVDDVRVVLATQKLLDKNRVRRRE